jgi:hypothetical protein
MIKTVLLALALACTAPTLAHAEVLTSSPGGFIVRQVMSVPTTPDVAYRKFVDVAGWWSSEHTFSGDAKNLSMTPRADGCWCEKLPHGGFVRHMAVVYAAPGKTIRFNGGLGPLQEMAVNGAMQVTFEADGSRTNVTLTYAVGGYSPNGLGPLAPLVDGVLGQQMLRYREFAGQRR